jgi:hypothetical protein
MATIEINPSTLTVRFTRGEKIGGLLRDIEVPLAQLRTVTVEPHGLSAVRGIRAPGLALPGRRKIGTWRRRGHRSAVSVRAGEPAVRLALAGHRYDELVIGTPEAERTAARLRAGRRA